MEISFNEKDNYFKILINRKFNSIFTKKSASNLSLFLPDYDKTKTMINRERLFNQLKLDKKFVFNPELEHFNKFYFVHKGIKKNNLNVKMVIPIDFISIKLFENYYKNIDLKKNNYLKKFINKKNTYNFNQGFIEEEVSFNYNKNELFFNFHPKADAVGTHVESIIPMITYADCIPISLFAQKSNETILFSIHSGWRGTCLHLTNNIINWIIKKFFFKKEEIFLILGPAIGGLNYEVKQNIFFKKEFVYLIKYLSFLFDNNLNNILNRHIKSFNYYKHSDINLLNEYHRLKNKNKINFYGKIMVTKGNTIFSKNDYLILLYIINNFFYFSANEEIFFDYKKLLLWLLEIQGIKNIMNLNLDTFSDNRFSSFRKDKNKFLAQALLTFIK